MRNLVSSGSATAEPTRVVVVGGGAAGVITAGHLLRAADPDRPVDVRIVEPRPAMGPGLAYATDDPLHTLNNFAGRLSAVDGDPDHLLRWCAGQGHRADPMSFLPRGLYGRYLSGLLDGFTVPAGSALRRTRALVTDLGTDGPDLSVQLAGGWTVPADKVVLALGNPPPRRRPDLERLGDRYRPDPWAEQVSDRVESSREVLLLGTGLTMVDVVATLHRASPGTRFTAVSRHRRLPTAHKRRSLRLHDIFDPGASSLDALVARVHARIQEVEEVGGDWRDVVDSVRGRANDLWRGLTAAEQDRFVEQLVRHWEVARHRMAPDMAARIDRLRESGTLRIGRVGDVDPSDFDLVVNCTGPAPVPTRGWNPLVDALLEHGTIRPHRLGLGVDLSPDGCVIDAAGATKPDVFAVGAARRGIEWEVAAIPDLRDQAVRLAEHVVKGQAGTHATIEAADLAASG